MSSIPTISNGFEMQGTGDNAGTWGEVLDRALAVIDESVDGITTVPVGPDIILNSTVFVSNQARRRMLKTTGAGGNVTVPGVPKWYVVHNTCAGAVTVKTAAASGTSIAPGTITAVYCDGTNCRQFTNLWPLLDGTAAVPSLYFSADISTGFYRVAANSIGATCGGSRVLTIAPTGLTTSLSTNGPLSNTVTNVNAGAAADALFIASNGGVGARFGQRGTAQTAYGALTAGAAYAYVNAAPLVLMADSASGLLLFAAGSSAETARNYVSGGFATWRFGPGTYNFSANVGAASIGYFGGGSQYGIVLRPQSDNTTSLHFVNAAGTTVGSIAQTPSVTTYNTSSDYRLKNEITDLTGSGEFIDALRPRQWVWKEDDTRGAGFIAHEAAEVSPSSVTGDKDAVGADGQPLYQGMQPGSGEIVAMMVAELQALRGRVAALEAQP